MTSAAAPLPPLREELSLHRGPADRSGAPQWVIRDPVRNRFFQIGWPAFEILSRWSLGSPEAVAQAVNAETALQVESGQVQAVGRFLTGNQLTRPQGHGDSLRLARESQAQQQSWAGWLLHHYLFFRLPLVRPDRFLAATQGLVGWLGSSWFLGMTLLALAAGLALVARQWDQFAASFVDTLTLSGMVSYGLALAGVKLLHELAHGYTAKRFGCRVPTMGVAFLVLWPLLYTDVNDTWLLPDRRQRLAVGAAGILAELTVAAWATLAWSFLPEGPARQAAFVLAAVTWVSSLAINLSPFMRFDGYFLLMDGLGLPNLHPRSFAMARWWLRETLFGLGEPAPEPMAPAPRRVLVAFAFAVWIYRLLLFLGIAVLVYHFFIKAVGVLLFVVEILWFVLLPVWSEVKEWLKRRPALLASRRSRLTGGVLLALLLLAAIPWRSQVEAPAMLRPEQVVPLHLPFPARLEEILVRRGEAVAAGQPLLRFASPDIGHRLAATEARLQGRLAELEAAQLDPFLQDRLGVLREEAARLVAEQAALQAEASRLTVTAPHGGRFVDPLPDLAAGDWLSPRQPLGVVRSEGAALVTAYVQESDRDRLQPGAAVRFFPHSLDHGVAEGRVASVDQSPVRALADGALASIHGGDLPARVSGQQIVPEGAVYRVRIRLEQPAPELELAGTALIEGEARSLLGRLARSVMVVLVREWGA